MKSENFVDEHEYKGYKIKIYLDENPSDPRDWEPLGNMVCFHSKYKLGDKHNFKYMEDFKLDLAKKINVDIRRKIEYWQDLDKDCWVENLIEKALKDALILPLYLYDHSGITMNTTGFSCKWDSGQVGWIYVTKDDIRKEFEIKNVTKKYWEKAKQILIYEVSIYDNYICGDVYGYVVLDPEDESESLDSCWGYFGQSGMDQLITEAKQFIDYTIKKE